MSSRDGTVCSETNCAIIQECTEGPPAGPAGRGSFRSWAPVADMWMMAPSPSPRQLPSPCPAIRRPNMVAAPGPWPPLMSEAVNEVDADGSKWGGVLVVVNIIQWHVFNKWCINELSSFEFPLTFVLLLRSVLKTILFDFFSR